MYSSKDYYYEVQFRLAEHRRVIRDLMKMATLIKDIEGTLRVQDSPLASVASMTNVHLISDVCEVMKRTASDVQAIQNRYMAENEEL